MKKADVLSGGFPRLQNWGNAVSRVGRLCNSRTMQRKARHKWLELFREVDVSVLNFVTRR